MVSKPKCHSQRNDEKTKSGEFLLPLSSVFLTTKIVKLKVHRTPFFLLFYTGLLSLSHVQREGNGLLQNRLFGTTYRPNMTKNKTVP